MKDKFWKAAQAAWVILAGACFATPAWATRFTNQFTEFELPPKWQCNLEGTRWVCQSSDESRKRDAIIILAAKLKGDQDSMDQYMAYLKTPKSWVNVQGKTMHSMVKSANNTVINDQPWVDALHLDSEIPGFYTRYLATVKQDIGVLITYSINKAKYAQYQSDFNTMVKTLKVFRKAGSVNLGPSNSNLFNNPPPALTGDTVFPNVPTVQGGTEHPKPAGGTDIPLLPVLLVAAVIGYIIWRKRANRD